ncbi:SRPBCC domain-containing protein [uncultured Alsobacter sp.]|uniref:SRPBCC family protein n=1 Tax=uncultured Alsobacter sp. TaxID=1748258 RepID=UPI0025EE2A36|nr:SRPBCC domain-containing protein [uncultured Alsobacter sp.]
MTATATGAPATAIRDIVVEEVFPHSPETIWRALTSGELIGRWLMAPTGFAPLPGTRFTFQTKAGGSWDGVIHCQVLEVVANERFVYSWKGGHADNVGYGSPLDTTVTWTLTRTGEGTRVRLVHAGFAVPRNQSALDVMGNGWKTVVPRLGSVASEQK